VTVSEQCRREVDEALAPVWTLTYGYWAELRQLEAQTKAQAKLWRRK
jgi:hypothetical protein